jgi:hypothetical protein
MRRTLAAAIAAGVLLVPAASAPAQSICSNTQSEWSAGAQPGPEWNSGVQPGPEWSAGAQPGPEWNSGVQPGPEWCPEGGYAEGPPPPTPPPNRGLLGLLGF